MAPLTVRIPPAGVGKTTITAVPLTAAAFQAFGDVISHPQPAVHPSTFQPPLSMGTAAADAGAGRGGVLANQATAIKYAAVTSVPDLYAAGGAPSGRKAGVAVSVFVCGKRRLEGAGDGSLLFPVRILERHPFTTQIFVPLSSTNALANQSSRVPGAKPSLRYLVVVAPSLPTSPQDASLPVPDQAPASASGSAASSTGQRYQHLPGRGLPDLSRLRAFVATDRQAVAYGPGTWHAPMVALDTSDGGSGSGGKETIDFVVVQLANGVALEDCQEVVFSASGVAADGKEGTRPDDVDPKTGLGVPGAVVRVEPSLLRGTGDVKAKL